MSAINCKKCGQRIALNGMIGTKNRNHCPYCLHSLHVDSRVGDRKSNCLGIMTPIAVTFKQSKKQKYNSRAGSGEVMLVHRCEKCGKISINRLAADDDSKAILQVLDDSQSLDEVPRRQINSSGIGIAGIHDRKELIRQLFGSDS